VTIINDIRQKFSKWIFGSIDSENAIVYLKNMVTNSNFNDQQKNQLSFMVEESNLTEEQASTLMRVLERYTSGSEEDYSFLSKYIDIFKNQNIQDQNVYDQTYQQYKQAPEDASSLIGDYIQRNAVFNEEGEIINAKINAEPKPAVVNEYFQYFTNIVESLAADEDAAARFLNTIAQIDEVVELPQETADSLLEGELIGNIPSNISKALTQEGLQELFDTMIEYGMPFTFEAASGKEKNIYPIAFMSPQGIALYNKLAGNKTEKIGDFMQSSHFTQFANYASKKLKAQTGTYIPVDEMKNAMLARVMNALAPRYSFNTKTRKLNSLTDGILSFFHRNPMYLPDSLQSLAPQLQSLNPRQKKERQSLLSPHRQELTQVIDGLIEDGNEDLIKHAMYRMSALAAGDMMQDVVSQEEQIDIPMDDQGKSIQRTDIVETGLAPSGKEVEIEGYDEKTAQFVKEHFTATLNEARNIASTIADRYREKGDLLKADITEAFIDLSADQISKVITPENNKMKQDLYNAGYVARYRPGDRTSLEIVKDRETNLGKLINSKMLINQIDQKGREKLDLKKSVDRLSARQENVGAISNQLNISEEDVVELQEMDAEAIRAGYLLPDEKAIREALAIEGEWKLKILEYTKRHPDATVNEVRQNLGIGRVVHPLVKLWNKETQEVMDEALDAQAAEEKEHEIRSNYIEQTNQDFIDTYLSQMRSKHGKRVRQYVGDNVKEWMDILVEMIPETSDAARRAFLDLAKVHSTARTGTGQFKNVTERFYKARGEDPSEEVRERISEFKKTRKKKAEVIWDLMYSAYKQAEQKINKLQETKKIFIKLASSSTNKNSIIDRLIENIIKNTKQEIQLYKAIV